MEWVSVRERKPKRADGNELGYVVVYLRKDRQWGFPTRIGFTLWKRVVSTRHTHWSPFPEPPIKKI